MTAPLILASTSSYRKTLLEKLGLPFTTAAPAVDETAQANEAGPDLVARLAYAKAAAIAQQHPDSWVIGSDQVAVLDQSILGKPHTHDKATEQLRNSSGRVVTFYTGLCLMNLSAKQSYQCVEPFAVHFRELSDAEIDAYLLAEKPYDCAGSFKSEGLGITLFERLAGDDPNALVGLPLIRLSAFLRAAGF